MSKFISLLAELPAGMTKVADIESPDEVQLEQDFGRLAYTFLRDRAAGLMPYLLGFEVVDREEDGSRAVGIFGFKIGNEYYYVPAFFVNNQIKGMDMLFSKKNNTFMPLRESWVNYIVNHQTIRLGESAGDHTQLRKDFEQPRFDFLAEPPTSPAGVPKTAEALDVVHDGFNTWNELQQAMADALEKDAEFQQAWGGAIARLENSALPFEKNGEASTLVDWIEKKGGVRAVNCLMRTITENPGFAKAALQFYPDVESLFVTKFAADLAPEKQAAKITVITQKTDYIDGKERKRLVRDGFTIHDTRDDAERSEVYEIDYEKRFHSPDNSGLYNILLRSGGTARAWVFMPSDAAKCPKCVVVDTSGKNYFLAEPGAVFVRGDEFVEGPNAYEQAVALTKMQPGQKYLLVNEKGEATTPFKVEAVIAENDKRVKARVYWKTSPSFDRPTYGHDFETLGGGPSYDNARDERDYLQFAEYNGRKLTYSGKDTVVVPANWKALPLIESDSDQSYEATEAQEDAFCPGTLTDVMEALTKHAFHKLMVGSDDGMEYYVRFDDDFVDGKPVNYKSAMVRLVGKYGLSVDDAETMLKEAGTRFKSRRMVKLGQMVGVSIPAEPPQAYGSDQFTGAVVMPPQVDTVEGSMTGVPATMNTVQPGFNLGGEAEIDTQAAGLAEQAAAAGQKQVFDHAAIGGLSRLYDSGAVIDSYVPELMKALDRIGRILFLFYWKNEEFAERYGSEDLAEMEDMLRGVFKSFGDLVLKLRQKAIDSEDAESAVM